jgi:hypothetical protein
MARLMDSRRGGDGHSAHTGVVIEIRLPGADGPLLPEGRDGTLRAGWLIATSTFVVRCPGFSWSFLRSRVKTVRQHTCSRQSRWR